MPVRLVKSEDDAKYDVPSHPNNNNDHNNPHLMRMDEDDNDEVVQEIDVFLSPTLAGKIHLLQFPLTQLPPTKGQSTNSHTTIHSMTPSEARIKALHGKLELDVPLPSNMERDGGYTFVDDLRTFQSQTIPIQTHLCLAKMTMQQSQENGGTSELHLVPLTDIKQMRPSFHHVDAEDQDNGVDDNRDNMETDAVGSGAGHKPVVFQRKESERAAHARKSSYAYKKASEDSEEWTALDVCVPQSNEYQQVVNNALCDNKHQQVLANAISQSTYLQSLQYLPEGGAGASKIAADDFDGHDLKSIVARLSSQMQGGGPIPWVVLRANFDSTVVSNAQLLQALTVVSVLVRGNFCVHSKFLPSLPPAAARARTFLLLLLHLHGSLHRPRLDRVFNQTTTNSSTTLGLSSDQLLSILQTLAQKTSLGWTLRLPDDEVFVRNHPTCVRKHNEYWKRQEQRFRQDLTLYNATAEI